MSSLRSLERQVIKKKCYAENHNTKNFKDAWEKHHYPTIEKTNEDGTITSIRSKKKVKKKQYHYSGKALIRMMQFFKNSINNIKNESTEVEN